MFPLHGLACVRCARTYIVCVIALEAGIDSAQLLPLNTGCRSDAAVARSVAFSSIKTPTSSVVAAIPSVCSVSSVYRLHVRTSAIVAAIVTVVIVRVVGLFIRTITPNSVDIADGDVDYQQDDIVDDDILVDNDSLLPLPSDGDDSDGPLAAASDVGNADQDDIVRRHTVQFVALLVRHVVDVVQSIRFLIVHTQSRGTACWRASLIGSL